MKTKKKSAAYRVFIKGDDSSRPEHLQFNDDCHKFLWIACPIAALSAGLAAIHQGVDIDLPWQLILVPPLFRFNEVWNPPDNDYAWKLKPGFRKFYWYIYSVMLPRHRSVFSHSLLFGTPLRFCIAYWIPILLFVLGWNYDLLSTLWTTDAIAWFTAIQLLSFPKWAIIFIGYWYAAAALSDTTHMILDRYNPIQWFIGKK